MSSKNLDVKVHSKVLSAGVGLGAIEFVFNNWVQSASRKLNEFNEFEVISASPAILEGQTTIFVVYKTSSPEPHRV